MLGRYNLFAEPPDFAVIKGLSPPLYYFGNRGPIDQPGYQSQQQSDLCALLIELKKEHGGQCFKTCYDLFSGSASLTIMAMQSDIADQYIANDLFFGLAVFWQQTQTQTEALIACYKQHVRELTTTEHPENYYQQCQRQLNDALDCGSPPDPLSTAALVAFVINHAQRGMPYFEQNKGQAHLSCVYDPENVSCREDFALQVRGISRLLAQRHVRFTTQDFNDFVSQITPNDLVLLDPPYPSLEDAKENPAHYLYHRSEAKTVLQAQLEALVQKLESIGTPYLLFYGLCGKEGAPKQPPLQHKRTFLRLSGGEKNPFGDYVEYVYSSAHFLPYLSSHHRILPFTDYVKAQGLDQRPYGDAVQWVREQVSPPQEEEQADRPAL